MVHDQHHRLREQRAQVGPRRQQQAPLFRGRDKCAQRAAARAGSLSAPTVGGGPAPRSEVTRAARKARQSPRSSAETGWEWWANWSSSLEEEEARAARVGLVECVCVFFFAVWFLLEGERERATKKKKKHV